MANNSIAVAGRDTGSSGAVKSVSNKIIDIAVAFGCILAILICLLPVLNVLAISLSSELAVINGRVFFWPVDFDLTSYKSVFGDPAMQQCLKITVVATILSTVYSMIMTAMCAYPLSQNSFVGRKLFNTIIILTMYFSAGMIPDYMNIQSLGLLNNFWVLILPTGISVFNMIILKSFFQGIPESLKESAQLDGASHWVILFKIYLPLSTPALATLTLLYAVGRWNGFQDVRLYVTDSTLHTLAFRLYQLIKAQASTDAATEGVGMRVAAESLKAASVMFGTIPIMLVYPWLQRYFVKGITMGAVKG